MKTINTVFTLLLGLAFSSVSYPELPVWSYDAGPNKETQSGKELIDLTASIPNMPQLSKELTKRQKFRPAFGPIPWRMRVGKNQVKVLFIGQDGTHIAEAAGRPATAGFGGRAQDLARYFGVNESAAFINTYAFTIKGQYGAYETPYVYKKKNGEYDIRFANLVDNKLWMMSMNQRSPITKWRNNLIDWIIKNNQKTMKLIITFGGAARDAVATYIESKGAKVGARFESSMSRIQVPQTALGYAGGNNQFPYPLNKDGKDLYGIFFNKKMDYKKATTQAQAKNAIKNNIDSFLTSMIFTKKGPLKNGLLNAAQLGGYDLSKIKIADVKTRSLKGLKLNSGETIKNDILVVELPHPSYLSRLSKAEASKSVANKTKVLLAYSKKGWRVEADKGQVNKFDEGEDYKYSRSNIGPEFYDFGTPGSRMVPVSSASRMSGKAHVIVFGTRDRASFDTDKLTKMTKARPAKMASRSEFFIARPRGAKLRYEFDAGPGAKYAKIMKENLNLKKILKAKSGMSWKENGVDAYNVKAHPQVADFGHYRGTFKDPKVIILADPEGYDDLITARALTGERGQYLQGLMNDLGVEDDYLILKTVPFGMAKATKEEWSKVFSQTRDYRENIFRELLKENSAAVIIADGEYARESLLEMDLGDIPVVYIDRKGIDKNKAAGISAVARKLMNSFSGESYQKKMANIPRTHLSFYARNWEGTSGDRVLNSRGKFRGQAFAVVAPEWAYKQTLKLSDESQKSFNELLDIIEEYDFLRPGESIPKYLRRIDIDITLAHYIEVFFKNLLAA